MCHPQPDRLPLAVANLKSAFDERVDGWRRSMFVKPGLVAWRSLFESVQILSPFNTDQETSKSGLFVEGMVLFSHLSSS